MIGRIYRKLSSLFLGHKSNLNPERPSTQHLIIETISSCNVRCVWCPMQNFNKHKFGFMSLDNFNKIILRNKEYLLSNNIIVEPYFRGEPLLHPQFWDMVAILNEHGIRKSGINSNLSLNIDANKFKELGLSILVNIGGTTKDVHEAVMKGSDFDLVTKNLKDLFSNRAAVSVKMNPTKQNIHQLKSLPEFVKSLGGLPNAIVAYTTCYPLPKVATNEEINYFFNEIVSPEMDEYLRFTYDNSAQDKAIKAKTPGCNFLMDVIFFDGQMSVCCHDQLQMIDVGNAFKTSIEDIKGSNIYAEAVKTAKACGFPFCAECN